MQPGAEAGDQPEVIGDPPPPHPTHPQQLHPRWGKFPEDPRMLEGGVDTSQAVSPNLPVRTINTNKRPKSGTDERYQCP